MLYALLFVLATHAENFWGDSYAEVNATTDQQFQIYEALINNDSLWAIPKEERIDAIKDAVYLELEVTPSDRVFNEKTIARREFIRSIEHLPNATEFLAVWDTQIWAGSPPDIQIVGSDMEILKDSVWTDPGAIASDVVEGVLPFEVDSTVDTSVIGLHLVTYTATDEAGQSTSITREVTVYEELPEGE